MSGLVRVDARDMPGQVRGGRASADATGAVLLRLALLLDVQAALYGPGQAATRDRAVGEARAHGGYRRQAPRGDGLVRRGAQHRGENAEAARLERGLLDVPTRTLWSDHRATLTYGEKYLELL